MKQEKSSNWFKRIMLVFGALTIVIAIHVWWVTRPKAPDPHTIVMARIDIKSPLTDNDGEKIKTWLYRQAGVDHVVVYPRTGMALFTFYPARVSGDTVVRHFQASFHYDAKRFVPTKEEIANSCPALPESVTAKISSFIKHHL